MGLSAAARVGMLAVVAFILMGLIFVQVGHVGPDEGVRYHVFFEDVQGMQVRAPVHLSGVRIGYVADMQLNEQNRVDVAMQVTRKDVKLFSSDYFIYTITGNLLGDKWLDIKPGPVPEGVKPATSDDPLVGTTPVSLDTLAQEGSEVMKELQSSIASLNELIGDEGFQKDIKVTVTNFRDISGNLKGASSDARVLVGTLNGRMGRLADSMDRVMEHADNTVALLQEDTQVIGEHLKGTSQTVHTLVDDNSGNVNTIVTNLRQMSSSLKNTAASLETLADNPQVHDDVINIVANIRKVSEEVAGIAGDVRNVTGDPQVQSDIKETITNVREASGSAKRITNKVEGVVDNVTGGGKNGLGGKKLFEADLSQEWNLRNGQASTNINALLFPYSGPFTLKLGVDAIGHENLVNLQVGKTWDSWRVRGGVVRSQFGVGADAWLFDKRFETSVDVYDTRDVKVDVTGKVLLPSDFYIYGGVRDVTDSHNSSPIVGAGKRF